MSKIASKGVMDCGRRQASDTVSLKALQYKGLINNKQEQFTVTADLSTSFKEAADTDDLRFSINYKTLSEDFKKFSADNKLRSFRSFGNLGKHLLEEVVFGGQRCDEAVLTIKSGLWQYKQHRKWDGKQSEPVEEVASLKGLPNETVIGVFTHERFKKQPVIVDVDITVPDLEKVPIKDSLQEDVKKYVESTGFKTVEALALNVSKLVLKDLPEDAQCAVQCIKTDAVAGTDGVGVTARRSHSEVADDVVEFNDISIDKFSVPNMHEETELHDGTHIAYIAFGSNEGNQVAHINDALKALEEKNIRVLATSSIFKSKPMYYLDQADFYNGALKVSTSLTPEELLKAVKDIEYNIIKRVKEFDNGPRSIDLDILLYDNVIMNTPDLNVPHIRMLERTFVLKPLCELVPPTMLHPVSAEPLHEHLKQLEKKESDQSVQESSELADLIPIGTVKPLEYSKSSPTQVMAILNVTPDSFSDGDKKNLFFKQIMAKVDDMVTQGVDIIDVGGCSTRPDSTPPTEWEEASRVMPIVSAIKKKYGDKVYVSVDTYRASVAEKSIKQGADIINDISAGMFDDQMYSVIAKYQVPYVINHTRGNIETMTKLTDYSETATELQLFDNQTSPDHVLISEVGKELSALISKMYSAGIRRWQLVLDPGLGFAKGVSANLSIIRNLDAFEHYKQLDSATGEYISFDNIPVLLGPSRKRFIGTITDESINERSYGTAACVAVGIGNGARIMRVHDYKPMKDVCRMSDAIYRNIITKK